MNCPLFPRKRTFETEALASVAADRLATQLEKRIRTYVCPFCTKWHLSKRKRKLGPQYLSPKKLRRLSMVAEQVKNRVSSEKSWR
jgi:hypothetical protein